MQGDILLFLSPPFTSRTLRIDLFFQGIIRSSQFSKDYGLSDKKKIASARIRPLLNVLP